MTIKEGWRGRFYEDFEVGDEYRHGLGRTLTQNDNIWFTLLTQNTAPLHFDAHYAAQTEFGRPLINSCLTLALVTGQTVSDVSQTWGGTKFDFRIRCLKATRSIHVPRCWTGASRGREPMSASSRCAPKAITRAASLSAPSNAR